MVLMSVVLRTGIDEEYVVVRRFVYLSRASQVGGYRFGVRCGSYPFRSMNLTQPSNLTCLYEFAVEKSELRQEGKRKYGGKFYGETSR